MTQLKRADQLKHGDWFYFFCERQPDGCDLMLTQVEEETFVDGKLTFIYFWPMVGDRVFWCAFSGDLFEVVR